jgi:hypothetical protein
VVSICGSFLYFFQFQIGEVQGVAFDLIEDELERVEVGALDQGVEAEAEGFGVDAGEIAEAHYDFRDAVAGAEGGFLADGV